MSYEIIYNAFSVRQGEAVIPYVISKELIPEEDKKEIVKFIAIS